MKKPKFQVNLVLKGAVLSATMVSQDGVTLGNFSAAGNRARPRGRLGERGFEIISAGATELRERTLFLFGSYFPIEKQRKTVTLSYGDARHAIASANSFRSIAESCGGLITIKRRK